MMKKQLLCLFAVLLSTVAASATSVGDYIYTPTAKFKVTGDNIVTNGNFASTTDGWTTTTGAAVDLTKFTVVPSAGPNGENVIQSANVDGSEIAKSIALEAGKVYIVSYDIYATSAFSTTVAYGSTNYVGIYCDADGSFSTAASGYRLISEVTGVKANEWQTVADTITTSSAENLQIVFQNIAEDTKITNIEVREASSVYDTRIAQRVIDYCDYLAGLDEWKNANSTGVANGLDDFQVAIATVKAIMTDAATADDAATMNDAITSLITAEKDFLDANSGDMSSQFTGWEDTNAKFQTATSIGDWVLTGGRWYHCNNVYTAEYVAKISSEIHGFYDLPNATATLTKTMDKGRYMFALDLSGYYYSGSTKELQYVPNYESDFTGAAIFANGDVTTCDTLDTRNYTTYTKFFDAPEGDNNVSVGATYTLPDDMVGKKLGGVFNVANCVLRKLGTTAPVQNRIFAIKAIQLQQNALRKMIDSATVVKPNTEFPWGKAVLGDSIDIAEGYYSATLGVIDASGNVLKDELLCDENGKYTPSPAYAATITEYMRYIRSAIQNYYSTNSPYTTLTGTIEFCTTDINDKDNASGDKATLQAVIDEANALVKGVKETEDADNFNSMNTKLMTAREAFLAGIASYANPANVVVTNPSFITNGGKKSRKAEGWTVTGQTDNGLLKFTEQICMKTTDNPTGVAATVDRGYTAFSKNKVVQTVSVTQQGLYIISCQAYAYNNNVSYDDKMLQLDATTGDTIAWNTGVFLFAGKSGVPDSLQIHTDGVDAVADQYSLTSFTAPRCYIYYNKTTPATEAVDLEFGLDALNNLGCNDYGSSNYEIKFYGDSLQYEKDKAAAEATGIENVPVSVKATSNGIYSISGMKVNQNNSTANLPKGIYIIKGKKYVVK